MKIKILDSKLVLKFIVPTMLFVLVISCNPKNNLSSFNYGTQHDSARYHYLRGFHEILDNGRWTESEKSFRKAVELDPGYTLGKSLVGRITRNLEERKRIQQELLAEHFENGDEKLLLDVYLLSIEAYNSREEGITLTPEFRSKRKRIAESNFREFVRKYPNDDYVKAEYIEWLHLIHGPETALDSLQYLATERQKKLGFYISFAASLELELGRIDNAIRLSEDLKDLMKDSTYTAYTKLKAEIFMAQDSLQKAKDYIDEVVRIDPNHLIAVSIQSEIHKRLKSE